MAERKIGANSYRVKPPLATTSITMMIEAGKIAGPGLNGLLASYALKVKGEASEDAVAPLMVAAVGDILKAVDDPEGVTDFLKRFVALAEIKRSDYEAADINDVPPAELVPLLGLIAEEAFGGFFSGGGASR